MKKQHLMTFLTGLFFILPVMTGCAPAFGHKVDYARAQISVTPSPGGQVALCVHDVRRYVITGNNLPSYVGMTRGGFGNVFDVFTEDGLPLSQNMLTTTAESLRKAGYVVTPVGALPTDTREVAVLKLRATGAPRLLLIRLEDWFSDRPPYNPSQYLSYNVSVAVMNQDGAKRGEYRIAGFEEAIGPKKVPIGPVIIAAYEKKFAELLNNDAIQKALQP